MDEQRNSSSASNGENPKMVSFNDAARFLGLDTFTFYSLVQREEIPFDYAPLGELLISQDDLDKLAGKESSC
jgi:predicted HTH domain antitoxin